MSKWVAKHGAAVLTFDLYHEASRWGKGVSITSKSHPPQHLVGPKGSFVKLHKSQPVGLQVGTSTTCGAVFALTLKPGNAQNVESVWRWDAGQGSMQKDYKLEQAYIMERSWGIRPRTGNAHDFDLSGGSEYLAAEACATSKMCQVESAASATMWPPSSSGLERRSSRAARSKDNIVRFVSSQDVGLNLALLARAFCEENTYTASALRGCKICRTTLSPIPLG
ncbi:hypothetical protein Efla_007496 [Eimeria flavescens]